MFEHFWCRLLGEENHRLYWLLGAFVGAFGGESREKYGRGNQGLWLKAKGWGLKGENEG
jgi:hypothetical protein